MSQIQHRWIAAACLVIVMSAGRAGAQGPDEYTIVDGLGAGDLLTGFDPVVTGPGVGTLGVIESHGGGCPERSFNLGGTPFTTDSHYHGTLNGAADPNTAGCGWGRTVPGDFTAFVNGAVMRDYADNSTLQQGIVRQPGDLRWEGSFQGGLGLSNFNGYTDNEYPDGPPEKINFGFSIGLPQDSFGIGTDVDPSQLTFVGFDDKDLSYRIGASFSYLAGGPDQPTGPFGGDSWGADPVEFQIKIPGCASCEEEDAHDTHTGSFADAIAGFRTGDDNDSGALQRDYQGKDALFRYQIIEFPDSDRPVRPWYESGYDVEAWVRSMENYSRAGDDDDSGGGGRVTPQHHGLSRSE